MIGDGRRRAVRVGVEDPDAVAHGAGSEPSMRPSCPPPRMPMVAGGGRSASALRARPWRHDRAMRSAQAARYIRRSTLRSVPSRRPIVRGRCRTSSTSQAGSGPERGAHLSTGTPRGSRRWMRPSTRGEVARQGWNLFDGRFLLPTMVLHRAALDHNIALIADYCATNGVSLAPHGKTTMAPDIFALQLAAGAWAMTLATPWQARVAATVGVPRILIGNEVTDPAGIDWLGSTLDGPGPEVYCWVDSVAGVELLDARSGWPRATAAGAARGRAHGWSRWRSLDGRRRWRWPSRVGRRASLRLAGVTCFEGLVQGDDAAGAGRRGPGADGFGARASRWPSSAASRRMAARRSCSARVAASTWTSWSRL